MSILKHLPHAVGALAIALGGPVFAQALPGPMDDKPLTENWAPSKWGAGDRAGPPITRRTRRTSSGARHGQQFKIAHRRQVLSQEIRRSVAQAAR